MPTKKSSEPTFTRGEVAKILNVDKQTVKNREDAGKYPEPNRDLNNYRVYNLDDILNLQIITYGKIDTRPVISLLYDKGYRDKRQLGKMLDRALTRRKEGK